MDTLLMSLFKVLVSLNIQYTTLNYKLKYMDHLVSILCLFDLQGEEEVVFLKSCIRRKTDSIEKRFCFDVELVDR